MQPTSVGLLACTSAALYFAVSIINYSKTNWTVQERIKYLKTWLLGALLFPLPGLSFETLSDQSKG